VIPIEDEAVKDEMMEILRLSLADNTGAWTLGPDRSWKRREPAEGEERVDVQQALIDRAAARATEPTTIPTPV
jgi:polyphosphate kinase